MTSHRHLWHDGTLRSLLGMDDVDERLGTSRKSVVTKFDIHSFGSGSTEEALYIPNIFEAMISLLATAGQLFGTSHLFHPPSEFLDILHASLP